jgi:hypothetical protein
LISDEILSAYLDGELTPAERADVEKWLADDGSARQLLDELRAVGGALRGLPRRKLGEDLSRQVLRAAERRILLEGPPDEVENRRWRPMPPARRGFRRALTRRTFVWLTVTAGVVAAVLIVDRQQRQPGPGGKGDRQIVAGPAKPIRSDNAPPPPEPRRAGATPTIAGAPQREVDHAAPPGNPNAPRITASAGSADRLPAIQAADLERLADGVLVIHFDVTAETSRNKSFDKLLDSNGITWRCQHEQTRSAGGTEIASVYVEALPGQVAGVLAALSAQAQVFRSVDVAPMLGHPAQEIVSEYGRRIDGPPAAELRSSMPARPSAEPSRRLPPANNAARQRVLFVVHVLDGSED